MKYFGRSASAAAAANKVILVPYPAQGHVTPMLNLASVLLTHGLHPVLVVPEFIHRRISPQLITSCMDGNGILCVSIPDGLDEGEPRDFFTIEKAMEKDMPFHLETLVRDQLVDHDHGGNNNNNNIACMIVDLLASYAISVAHRCGVEVAGFWPAMLATYRLVASIPNMVEAGIISDDSGCPLQEAPVHFCPGQPAVSATEMPWLIGTPAATTSRFQFWKRTLDRSTTLKWLLVNTFSHEQYGDGHQSQSPYPYYLLDDHHNMVTTSSSISLNNIIPIRPINTIDSSRSCKGRRRRRSSSININGSFWEEDLSCLDWLDKQIPGSVIYVSFGSWVSPIGEANIKSLALALEASRRPFLLVLGPAWRHGLPKSFLERTASSSKELAGQQGKVVSWAPQMEVLQHEAVGCYLTHCGWNSTMEAIQCKKRLLCYPVAGDQFVNCVYIVNAWRIGVRLKGFGQRDVDEGVRRVTEDKEMSSRIERVKERLMGEEARCRAADNLTTFVNSVVIPIPIPKMASIS